LGKGKEELPGIKKIVRLKLIKRRTIEGGRIGGRLREKEKSRDCVWMGKKKP